MSSKAQVGESINPKTKMTHTEIKRLVSRSRRSPGSALAKKYCTKIQQGLSPAPRLAAGVTDRLWIVSDLVDLWESEEAEKRAA
jgi:hypothetical protein